MVTMIALMGEQTLPNFLPLLHYKPAYVLCLYTSTTRQAFERLQKTIQRHGDLGCHVSGLSVEAYDLDRITKSLKQYLEQKQLSGRDCLFNLTGGTKIMSLAAYQIAQEWQAPMFYFQSELKQDSLIEYEWQDGRPQQVRRSGLSCKQFSLADVLDLHLGPGKWQETKGKHGEGFRFEQTLANLLRAEDYEILQNIRLSDGQMEIDIIVRFQNRYGAIEAKYKRTTGLDIEAIKQLVTSTKQLGSYIQRFYILTVPLPGYQQELVKLLNIRTIVLESYRDGELSEEDRQKFLSAIAQVLR
ncbi:NERD domain-containing protein [Thermogemmatispora tikiterensis]|uniref:DUF1887 domain-containing protein n=1 Tax=Thermogemmatispora tikiterensis TaxID=1825093 RepID=A0A328VFL3_9CHLR|nr:DUF1887 family CARF protein [Thermogemmatispora tikiterensis]RAQ95709.1 hypothetical protein A4R35_09200 [Thermogemmatispora tikiterensis]